MTWIPSIRATDQPIYRAIADALEEDVLSGALRPGARLPTHRDLARQLAVDLTTVTRAYAEATKRGLMISEGRRGSFVRPLGRNVDQASVVAQEIASGMNMPPEPEQGALRERIASGVSALLARKTAPLQYQPSGGTEEQREAAAAFLTSFLGATSPDQAVIAAGSQNALFAILSLVASRGEAVAAPCLTYPGFLTAAHRLGLSVKPVVIDQEGIVPESVEEIARRSSLKALYVVPTNDNPTAATLPLSRRNKIAAIAAKHGITVIEDDAYGQLAREPVQPIASMMPELSWHLLTTSKLLSPSLRVSFVKTPSVREAMRLASCLHDTAGMAPPINADLVASWLNDGIFGRLLSLVQESARARMAEASAILNAWQPAFDRDGYHLWLPLPQVADPDRIAAQAVAAGLPVVGSRVFAVSPVHVSPAIRVSLGGSTSLPKLTRELRRLDALLAQSEQGGGVI